MALKPKFIYFDLDDTLLDHRQAERSALGDVYKHFDLFEDRTAERLVNVYQQVNSEQWKQYSQAKITKQELQRNRFEKTLRALQVDPCHYDRVGSQYMEFYQRHWQWISGAKEAFDSIRQRFPVGILTNGFAETQKKKFAEFNLHTYADHLVISEEVGAMKPHPDVFEYATKLTGHAPDEILYIGDSYHSDVTGGTNFGWNVAWYTQNGDAKKREKATFTFSSFKELSHFLNHKN